MDSMVLDHGEWFDTDDADEPMTLDGMMHHSVGFLVKENDHSVLLCSSHNMQANRIQGGVVIPKSAIHRQETFAESKEGS